ncbi:erythrocyte membrane protein 1, PfEMP1, putative [Plasmodium reichenowi]|uniref:Erythrocyte membrane protein 1, PfEMP1, putative n=1 Tax=Plasmodium reichenowi TaxID=5854 RepID=A0A2P9D412_PLARE|nr:erythrocyte membrane protein 1, PfEMP1, putative [Plasmodium reichenowi]
MGGGTGGEDGKEKDHKYKFVADAKDLLDRIGETIQKQARDAALPYEKYLHGHLSQATFSNGEKVHNDDPCQLNYNYDTNVTSTVIEPCNHKSGKRLSELHSGECDNRKIRGNNEGACAPFRRLHVCDTNLEQIKPAQIESTHNLLADVCMAAKFEGQSISGYHPQYEEQYPSSGSTMCTMLARSFADIGDIIRGKDLFLGNNRKDKLENNLKRIFGKIHEKLTAPEAKKRYEGDGDNYYKLREDWWALNRKKVWDALTCHAPNGEVHYFRKTCSDGKSHTYNKCQCIGQTVPTYLDYVPQFLRWFEEWAEDFCRKRKHKLQNAKNKCRGEDGSGKDRYCDLNGYDCKKTASGEKKFVKGEDCHKCSVACDDFVKWIDNQKQEFVKQKGKYTNELSGNSRQRRSIKNNVYKGYDEEFYNELRTDYRNINNFLQKLSEEKICKDQPKIGDERESPVDFTKNDVEEIFSHTVYCQACPWCGMDCISDGKCTRKPDTSCNHEKIKKDYNNENTTNIPILTADKGQSDILKKYKNFCAPRTANGVDIQIKKWQCYYDDNKPSDENDNCIQGEWKTFKKDQKFTSYNAFFYRSIIEMLKESIDWREKLNSCINKNTCKNGCKSRCECYERWITQKKNEFRKIKEHFRKQKDMKEEKADHDTTLKLILNFTFLNDIEEAYPDKQQVAKIRNLLGDKIKEELEDASKKETSIDDLLDEELQKAKTCLQTHTDDNCPQDKCAARSLPPSQDEESDSDDEEEPTPKPKDTRTNPCYDDTTTEYPMLAHKVAEDIHKKTHKEMKENSVDSKGKNVLKADASLGKYNGKFNGSELSNNICSINEDEHSNRNAGDSKGPCGGKGPNRFKIGEQWKTSTDLQTKDPQLFLPPRREHMCTSNLEYLLRPTYGSLMQVGNGKFNHSFLGDVLNASKSEAEDIINKYKENKGNSGQNTKNGLEGDQATTCRSIRYSFADIGDIIRGKDLWDKNEWEKNTQSNLEKIFKEIKQNLPKKMQGKYDGDDQKTKPPYKQLREDWWTANRHQVWRAMTCATKKEKHIKCGTTPYDDYIPQRLRWMTEWAEWYCKAQSQEYWKLFTQCRTCKSKSDGQSCYNSDPYCQECKKACDKYTKEIEKWRKQWTQMDMKYTISYLSAQDNHAGKAYPDADYQQLFDFLKQLHTASVASSDKGTTKVLTAATPNTPYSTAARYIHQELPRTQCQKQREFCQQQNGSAGKGKTNEKYALSLTPHEYKDACKCNIRPPSKEDNRRRSEDSGEQSPRRPSPQPTSPQEPPQDNVNVCAIVDGIFKDTSKFKEACEQKYGGNNSRLGWKCVTTTGNGSIATSGVEATGEGDSVGGNPRAKRSAETSGSSDEKGAICIPPRRRKLYIHKVEDGEVKDDASLRDWFVKSAAVETFFLWHNYKTVKQKEIAEKERKKKEQQNGLFSLQLLVPPSSEDDDSNPETQLKDGTIPEEFLRQMFYTLGDYRDIFFGVSDEDVKKALQKSFVIPSSGESKGKETSSKKEDIMDKIKNAIDKIPEISGTPSTPPKHNGQQTKPEEWWKSTLGPAVWNGMVCALTYDTDTKEGTPPNQLDEVKKNLLEADGTKPKNDSNYTYTNAKIDEDSDTDAKKADDSRTSETKLSEFVETRTFFRWLHEWGNEFCKKRTEMLKQIKKECTEDGEDEKQKYSGDGEDCLGNLPENPTNFNGLEGPTCAGHCRKYRKWIRRKKIEFTEQSNAYTGQKNKCKDGSESGVNGVCGTLITTCDKAGDFLNKLKNRPCKNNSEEEGKKGENEIDFKNEGDTFKHTTHCDPCREFKVKCENGSCNGGGTNVVCNGNNGTITAENIQNQTGPNGDIEILVSDNNTNRNKFENGLETCKDANIFEGFRKEEWKCAKVCGYEVCTPKNGNGQKVKVQNGNDKHIITIRGLVAHWVQYFLEDYKKIKHKISHCIKNGKEDKCICGCDKKCKCVKQWVEKKRGEWKTIRDRFLEQYKMDTDEDFNLRSFLETLLRQIPVAKAKNKVIKLSVFDGSKGCCVEAHAQKNNVHQDAIDCMLKKLEDKANKCAEKHKEPSDKTETSGENQSPCVENPTLVGDDDPLEEENPVTQPGFCPPTQEPQEDKVLDEEECKAAPPPGETEDGEKDREKASSPTEGDASPGSSKSPDQESDVPTGAGSGDDKKDKDDQPTDSKEEKAPAPAPAPDPQKHRPQPQPTQSPIKLLDDPLVIPSLSSSTLMWSIGISFAALTYWFLKKKTRRPVDFLSVLEIPQNDYGIPTLKSSNRYIPYASGKYRGKRYIYLEGDTDEDKYAFMSDTTDVTSSESEYEEFDINDIYPYQSPKYKTLIEVVLEPSKRDTQNDIQSDNTSTNKLTDNEWNELKQNFISNMLQSKPKDLQNDYRSGNSPTNTNNTTMSRHNVDNNTHPTMSRLNRNLYTGEEYNYDMINNIGNNDLYSDVDSTSDNSGPTSGTKVPYSGIDLINDSLNSGNQPIDIYDEILKRKENELFGTENHPKRTSNNSVASPTNSDPLHNQLELFHKWFDRHKNMCEKWNNKEDILNKLKEEWENDNNNSGNKTSGNITPTSDNTPPPSDIPSGKLSDIHSGKLSDIHSGKLSDIPSGKLSDIPSSNKMLNTDVSIQIHMDNNPMDDNIYLDTYPDKYTVDNINPVDSNTPNPNLVENINPNLVGNINPNLVETPTNNPNHVQIQMSVKNTQMMNEKYPIGDVWDI